jgi:hypothetical protein
MTPKKKSTNKLTAAQRRNKEEMEQRLSLALDAICVTEGRDNYMLALGAARALSDFVLSSNCDISVQVKIRRL